MDDDLGVRNSLSAFLSRSGFVVMTAADGEQGIEMLQSAHPDLVVLDVLMPHLDGREALWSLCKAGNWTPVILLTQVGEAEEQLASIPVEQVIVPPSGVDAWLYPNAK